jgi:ketosteroid isomerase-like protein
MSREIEILYAGYDAWNRRDVAAVLDLLDPAIEYVFPDGGLNTDTLRGHEQVREFMDDYFEMFDELRILPRRFTEGQGTVVVEIQVTGLGRGSGAELESTFAHVWTFRGETAVRLEIFPSWAEAVESTAIER